jgi:hypothetical protein
MQIFGNNNKISKLYSQRNSGMLAAGSPVSFVFPTAIQKPKY